MSEDKQEGILQKVRGLLAKAASTSFEGERVAFLAKADELMEKYAIDEVLLLQKSDKQAKLVERRDMDMSWWWDLRELDHDTKSEIYWMWQACVKHCRCFGGTFQTYVSSAKASAVYGLPSDLSYLDMLFTDLMLQMVGKIRPQYDPSKTMGENAYNGKAAGMKYADIAIWMGRPDWVSHGKPIDNGVIKRAVKEYAEANGLDYIAGQPKAYIWSYVKQFCETIRLRLIGMRENRKSTNTGSMEVAIRDVYEQAREALWGDFPDLRPHPAGCQCKACKRKTRLVKYRDRSVSYVGSKAGRAAGESARIASNDPTLRSPKKIG